MRSFIYKSLRGSFSRVSPERLFNSEISLKDCKGCLEPKIQDSRLEP